MNDAERRRSARHPIPVPVVVRPRAGGGDIFASVADVSDGGLAFTSPRELTLEDVVDVTLSVCDRAFSLAGSVTSCRAAAGADPFRIGLAFLHPSMSFRMKLAEQVLRIQELRRELSEERGENVSIDAAAREWVARHAEDFAALYPA